MKCILVSTSITYAMKGISILQNGSINSVLVKTTDVRKLKGCGYGIEVNGDCEQAKRLLERNGILIVGTLLPKGRS